MEENLVIVESPAKAKTLEKFLGAKFLVKSSFGHVRDLKKKDFGVDIENNYTPQYEISPDKKKVVSELKKIAKQSKTIWLASDEDREGEAIAWHLVEVLGLKNVDIKRIVFSEITKDAILNAIKKPREIDRNLVDAQQARRILDRLVGFELSPLLWKKVKPSLSAGRVQSVAVRLLVEREREIINFKSESVYKVYGIFDAEDKNGKPVKIKAELSKKFEKKEDAYKFLEKCRDAKFQISDVITKPSKKSPSAPFTTSTLQQEASRKLGYSVSQTMTLAQRLYEAGKITYMRTDSVNLSKLAINSSRDQIVKRYGEKYSKPRTYKTKAKGAQEAHEAIRPSYIHDDSISDFGSNQEQKLYNLIWKRTIASQMSDAQIEKTTVTIDISTTNTEKFTVTGEVIKFDGFLKVYIESTDDDNKNIQKTLLPPLKINDSLEMSQIYAIEKFSHHPPRYNEASLVRKLEELGIGRPSTYAPTISTIQQRGYVIRESREGKKRKYNYLLLHNNEISEEKREEITGAEKNKLFPTDIGMVVTDFLVANFDRVLSYNFTATVEKEFDEIARGALIWNQMIDKFYKRFHPKVEHAIEHSDYENGQRHLGTDPKTGKPVYVRIGRYGPMAQIGEKEDEEKPKFASLRKGQHIETITLDQALELFKLPRTLGDYEDKTVVVGIGRFGPYVRHDNKFVSLKKDVDDPMTIDLQRAIQLIEEKREADRKKLIKEFEEEPDLRILNGRWGPYISYQKTNYKIPKDKDASALTLKDCKEIIKNQPQKGKKKTTSSKTKSKKTTTKTTTKKSTTKKGGKKTTKKNDKNK